MAKKFTKGPWIYRRQPVSALGYYIETEDQNHKDTFIGEVGGGLQMAYEIGANAKLIAAAPDLLDALIEILEERGTNPSADPEGFDKKTQNALLAIKKALE